MSKFAPCHNESDPRQAKCREGLREPRQNSHSTATKAIRHAQGAGRVARAMPSMSAFAPHHNGRDLTCWKSREGCASTMTLGIHKTKHETWTFRRSKAFKNDVLPIGLSHLLVQAYCTCHEKWAREIRSAAPARRNSHHHVQNQKRWQLGKNVTFAPIANSPNTPPATEMSPPKITSHFDPCLPTFWQRAESAAPATWMKKSPMSCTCHAKRRFRFQNATNAPRLPCTQHAHGSENEQGALVKPDLPKRQNLAAHCAGACAVETHMDIWKRLCKNAWRWRHAHGHLAGIVFARNCEPLRS